MKGLMTKHGWKIAFGAAASVLMVSLTMAGPVSAANTGGTCRPAQSKYVNDPDSRNTTSNSFVNLAGASLSFTQGGSSPSCVIVNFSGAAITSTDAEMTIRATLDNVANSLPETLPFIVNSANYEARSATFIFPSVAPGAHTVHIQFSASFVSGGSAVGVSRTNLIVQYTP